jgi:hypothetical protein
VTTKSWQRAAHHQFVFIFAAARRNEVGCNQKMFIVKKIKPSCIAPTDDHYLLRFSRNLKALSLSISLA